MVNNDRVGHQVFKQLDDGVPEAFQLGGRRFKAQEIQEEMGHWELGAGFLFKAADKGVHGSFWGKEYFQYLLKKEL